MSRSWQSIPKRVSLSATETLGEGVNGLTCTLLSNLDAKNLVMSGVPAEVPWLPEDKESRQRAAKGHTLRKQRQFYDDRQKTDGGAQSS